MAPEGTRKIGRIVEAQLIDNARRCHPGIGQAAAGFAKEGGVDEGLGRETGGVGPVDAHAIILLSRRARPVIVPVFQLSLCTLPG